MSDAANDDVLGKVIKWIEGVAGEGKTGVKADTAILDEGVIDSLMLLQLVAFLEKEFEVTVGVEAMTPVSFATPGAIVEMVGKLKAPE